MSACLPPYGYYYIIFYRTVVRFFSFFCGGLVWLSVSFSVYVTVKTVYLAVWWGLLDIVGSLSGPHFDDIRRHGAGSQTQRPCTIARLRPRACMGWAASVTLAAILQHFTRRAQPGRDQLYPLSGARCGARPGLLSAWAGHTSAFCTPCIPRQLRGGRISRAGATARGRVPWATACLRGHATTPRQSTPSEGPKNGLPIWTLCCCV